MPSKNTTNTVTPTCIPVLNTVMDTKSRVSSQSLSVIFQEMSSSLLGLKFIFREFRDNPTTRKVSVPFSQPIRVDFGTCTKWSSPQGLIQSDTGRKFLGNEILYQISNTQQEKNVMLNKIKEQRQRNKVISSNLLYNWNLCFRWYKMKAYSNRAQNTMRTVKRM